MILLKTWNLKLSAKNYFLQTHRANGELMLEKKPVYRLKVKSQFSASHQLRHYQGKCENLHGHNFSVEVEVEGSMLDPDTGILIDFKELKSMLNSIIINLDHKHLNELYPFKEDNPSSENISRYVYKELQNQLQNRDIRIYKVSVAEKESSKASYLEV